MEALTNERASGTTTVLREAWKDFTTYALGQLSNGINSNKLKVSVTSRQILRFTENGFTSGNELHPEYLLLLQSERKLLEGSDEYKRLAELCTKEPTIMRNVGQP